MKKHIRCASYRLFLLKFNIDFHVFLAVFSMNVAYFEIFRKSQNYELHRAIVYNAFECQKSLQVAFFWIESIVEIRLEI